MSDAIQAGLPRETNFIIFGEDFARHPHALEHLMRPMFAHNRVLWVETIGIRSPRFTLYDFKRVLEKLRKWLAPADAGQAAVGRPPLPPNVTVIAPFMIPFNKFSLIRRFNRWSVVRKVKAALRAQDMRDPVSIASVATVCDIIGAFGERLKIYFCVDEFSLWPGLDYQLVGTLERKLMANVDLIVATSSALSESKRIGGRDTPVITHGVDFAHFNIGPKAAPGTVLKLCYFGLFDARSDQDILAQIARRVAQCEIHIFGTVVCDVAQLTALPNVIFHGKVEYAELPALIADMDMFLLPYVRSKLTDNLNPLKLKEYLSTGRPVIATKLPEVIKFERYLWCADSSDDFIRIIEKLRHNPAEAYDPAVVCFVAENETWNHKAQVMAALIHDHSRAPHSFT